MLEPPYCDISIIRLRQNTHQRKDIGLSLMANKTSHEQELFLVKGPLSSEKYWHYFNGSKNVLCSILSFVFWIFPTLDTAVQLASECNFKISFSGWFLTHFLGNEKNASYILKKATFRSIPRILMCCDLWTKGSKIE